MIAQIPTWSPFLVLILLYSALIYFRRPGRGGKLGHRIRMSDWDAWRDAVNQKQRELDALRKVEPKV